MWRALPFEGWKLTCDTLHAHTQVIGKLAARLAPPEPQLQHAALRLTARGWETAPLPAPDGSGAFGVALDLRKHEALVEHMDGRSRAIPLSPNRSVRDVTRDVLAAVRELAGAVELSLKPQETRWSTRLDEDVEHATYDRAQVADYFAAASGAALVLAALRAPYRGRSTPVNAWWGSFDLAVGLFSGRPAEPPSQDFIFRNAGNMQQIEVGRWPGDDRYPRAAFYGYAYPSTPAFAEGAVEPGGWNAELGEFIFDWDEVIASDDPFETALGFLGSVVRHGCVACDWDPALAASLEGLPPPVG